MNNMTIANVSIRQDADGRYCLNDLHRAAGEEARHKPGNWLMLEQTKALAAEIEIAGIPAIQSKQGLGTFVVKELVYAYAMWISPTFNLQVIRAYDAQVATPAVNPANLTRLQILQLALESEEARQAAEAELAIAAPKAEALDRISTADGLVNLTVAAKILQVAPRKLFDWLRQHHWIYRRAGGRGNVAYQDKIQNGCLTHKTTTVLREDGTEKVVEQVMATPKGLTRLALAFGVNMPEPGYS